MKNEKYRPSPRSPCVGRELVRGKKSPYAGGFRGLVFYSFSFLIFHLNVSHPAALATDPVLPWQKGY